MPDLTLAGSSSHYGGVTAPRDHIIHMGLVVCAGFLLSAAAITRTLPADGCWPGQIRANLVSQLLSHHGVTVQPRDIILPGPAKPGLMPREVQKQLSQGVVHPSPTSTVLFLRER